MAEQLADGSAAPPDPVIIKDGQGQSYTVDASELPDYLRGGGYSIAPSEEQATAAGQIPLVDTAGNKTFANPEEAQARIQSFEAEGGRTADVLQAEEEARYGGALQGARALGLGIVENVPGAVPALTALDPTLAPELEKLHRYRPTAVATGNIGGFAALTALTGGLAGEFGAASAARLGTAAGLAEGGAALRAVGAAGRGAMEFGLMEANREVNEAAIQQREYDGAKIASAFAGGALLGGALMGGGSAVWSAARGVGSWGGSKITGLAERALPSAEGAVAGEKSLTDRVMDYARERTLKSTGGTATQLREIAESSPALRAEVDKLITQEIPKVLGKSEGAILENTARAEAIGTIKNKIGAEIGDAIKAIDAAGVATPNMRAIADEARMQLLAPLKANTFAKKEARAVEGLISDFREYEGGKMTFEGLKDLSTKLNEVINKHPSSSYLQEMQKFRGMMEAEIENGARLAGEKTGNTALAEGYTNAKLRYAAAVLAEDALQTGAKASGKSSAVDLMGAIAGGSGSSLGANIGGAVAGPVGAAVGGFLGGLGGAVAANLNKRFGDQVVSTALRAYANGNTAQLSTIVDRAVSTSVAGYLKAGTAKAVPAMGQAAATGTRVAATNYARETELGRLLFGEPTAKKAESKAPARVAFTPALKPSPRAEVSDAQTKRAVERIQASAQQQQAALERLAEQAPHLLPEIRGQLAASKRAHDYLLSKIPQSSNVTATLTPKLEAPRMSKAQRDELLTAVRVVSDPLSVLDSLKAGKVTKAEVDALKATAPELYASVQQAVQAQLDARETPLPYRQALDLSLLLGVVGHPSLDPATIQSIQAAYGPPPQSPGVSPQASAPKRTINTSRDWALRPEES